MPSPIEMDMLREEAKAIIRNKDAEIVRLQTALRWAFEKIPTNHVADWPEDYLLLAIELDARMPNVNEQLAPQPMVGKYKADYSSLDPDALKGKP